MSRSHKFTKLPTQLGVLSVVEQFRGMKGDIPMVAWTCRYYVPGKSNWAETIVGINTALYFDSFPKVNEQY